MSQLDAAAEVDSERCAALRRELAELQDRMCRDELRVQVVQARRIELGRKNYGYLVIATDTRNWKRERGEEGVDWLIYDAIDELDRDDKAPR